MSISFAPTPSHGPADRQDSAVQGAAETLSAGGAVEIGGRVRWERRHDGRCYEAVVQRNIFGGWELWLHCSHWAAGAGPLRHRAQPLGRGRLLGQQTLSGPGDRVDRRRHELRTDRLEHPRRAASRSPGARRIDADADVKSQLTARTSKSALVTSCRLTQ